MILGTGIDIIEIERVARAASREGFVRKILSPDETDYWEKKNRAAETLAGIFAAKEAAAKALGTGFGAIGWTEVEVLHARGGAPYIKLNGAAALRLDELSGNRVHISISHCRSYAVAQAIVE